MVGVDPGVQHRHVRALGPALPRVGRVDVVVVVVAQAVLVDEPFVVGRPGRGASRSRAPSRGRISPSRRSISANRTAGSARSRARIRSRRRRHGRTGSPQRPQAAPQHGAVARQHLSRCARETPGWNPTTIRTRSAAAPPRSSGAGCAAAADITARTAASASVQPSKRRADDQPDHESSISRVYGGG